MSKEIYWLGDSLEVVRSFPDCAKQSLGGDLRRLQLGLMPLDSRPMKSVASGVFELRDRDHRTWYRIIYFVKIADRIAILHAFTKNSAKTPMNDLLIASKRLKLLKNEEG